MVIRIHVNSEKGYSKAIKVAAAVKGVESVTIAGEEKNLLLVLGVGIDSQRITEKLRQKVGSAEVVELRTVDHHDGPNHHNGGHHMYRLDPSPYKHEAARDLHYYTGGYHHNSAGAYGQDHYGYGYGGAGGYQHGQYNKQADYFYPPQGNTHTVVHHGNNAYADDSCSIM